MKYLLLVILLCIALITSYVKHKRKFDNRKKIIIGLNNINKAKARYK